MMDVVVPDVSGEPGHQGAGFQEAGGFQGSSMVGPAGVVTEGDAGEVMLSVKKVTANGAAYKMRDNQDQEEGRPAQEESNPHRQQDVQQKSNDAVVVFARIVEAGIQAHPMQENENITEQDDQRMTHEKVLEASAPG